MKGVLSILQEASIERVGKDTAAGTGDVNSDGVDMSNHEGVIFQVHLGTITGSGVPSVKAQQSDDDGSSDAYSDLAGTLVTGDDADDDKIFVLEIYRPRKKFVRIVVGRATANVVIDSIGAIVWGRRKQPAVQGSDVVAESKSVVSPAEGTA